ncbi:hypothetical protein ONZ45_g11663 [Pleurotus djamor]|nr:hypothetical protein ONZ45_g11663 [Pleurotus djamor]
MPRSDADQQLFNAFQDTSKFGISIAELGKDERYKGYFMTIIADHECGISKELSKDATVERALTVDANPLELQGPQRPARTQHRAFVPRKHHRVVFKEFCSTVGDLETLGEVASVLEQTTIALRLMLCAGWVHRDISSGNILAFRPTDTEPRQAKLSDLKYARKYPPDPTYQAAIDPKTHDLESVWWIFLWTVSMRVPHEASRKFFRAVFNHSTSRCSSERAKCLLEPIHGMLATDLAPSLQLLSNSFEYLRINQLHHYTNRERNKALNDVLSFTEIHEAFTCFFKTILEKITGWQTTALGADNTTVTKADDVVTPAFSQKHTTEQPAAPARSPKKRTREGTSVGAQVDAYVLASVPE